MIGIENVSKKNPCIAEIKKYPAFSQKIIEA